MTPIMAPPFVPGGSGVAAAGLVVVAMRTVIARVRAVIGAIPARRVRGQVVWIHRCLLALRQRHPRR